MFFFLPFFVLKARTTAFTLITILFQKLERGCRKLATTSALFSNLIHSRLFKRNFAPLNLTSSYNFGHSHMQILNPRNKHNLQLAKYLMHSYIYVKQMLAHSTHIQ